MKKINFFVMILLFSVLYSCQQDESDMYVRNYNYQPQLKEYNPTSVEDVLTYMDSAYYYEHLEGNGNLINSTRGLFMPLSTDTSGLIKGKCNRAIDKVCLVAVSHNSYSNPCDSLMMNYEYDTTIADKDFLVICSVRQPKLYQGEIESYTLDSDDYLKTIDFDWINGYISFINDTIYRQND
jgi:hypothetical protein